MRPTRGDKKWILSNIEQWKPKVKVKVNTVPSSIVNPLDAERMALKEQMADLRESIKSDWVKR